LPVTVVVPRPEYVIPPQHQNQSPVAEFQNRTPPLESSWMQTSKVVTTNEQELVLPDASVAVQVTVVMPIGNEDPEGGLQEAVTPGQLSETVGGG
jgi:hypothetical protein